MSERIKIFHTDDHQFIRQSMRKLLGDEGIDIVGEAENGDDLLNLLKSIRPDIILLDLQMPKMDGNETLSILRSKYPAIPVIVFTGFTEESLIEDFKVKGAAAFLTKNADIKTIANTIKRTHYSANYNNFPHSFKSLFTAREVEIIPYLLAGKTSKEIADAFGLSTRTIEGARARVYYKTKCRNAPEFAAYCAEAGLQFLGAKINQIQR